MSENVKSYVTWVAFNAAITIIVIAIGWLFTISNAVSAELKGYSNKESDTQASLSEIKTDVKWLINSQKKDNK